VRRLILVKKNRRLPPPVSPPAPSKIQALATVPAATMEATSPMRPASTVECVPVESGSARMQRVAMESTAARNIAVVDIAMSDIAPAHVPTACVSVTDPAAPISPIRMSEPWTTAPSIIPTPVSQPGWTVEPWAGSHKDTAGEPIGTVVAVGRAGIRIVSVIAPLAERSRTNRNAHRPHANSDADSDLRL
jgi:hypothetical protein